MRKSLVVRSGAFKWSAACASGPCPGNYERGMKRRKAGAHLAAVEGGAPDDGAGTGGAHGGCGRSVESKGKKKNKDLLDTSAVL